MTPEKQKRPDERALQSYLEHERHSTKGLILRLAWREGLSREEICALQWPQVDFEEMYLRLPSRNIPLEEETAVCLRQFHTLYGADSPFVVVSDWTGAPIVPQYVSRVASTALKEAGMPDLKLRDLRADYITRQFETHDWPYALQVTGLSIVTYRQKFAERSKERDASVFEPVTRDRGAEERALEKLLHGQRADAATVALWLTKDAGLRLGEIVALTWEQVDLARGVLLSKDGELPLSDELRDILAELRAARLPDDDPHVLLSPQARKPYPVFRLSALVRDALIHAGIDGARLTDFHTRKQREDDRAAIMEYVAQHGSISREELCALLSIKKGAAYYRLQTLMEDGTLVPRNGRYYPSEALVSADDSIDAILRCANGHKGGAISVDEAAGLLHTGKRKAQRILSGMVRDGYLFMNYDTQAYMLRGPYYKRNQA